MRNPRYALLLSVLLALGAAWSAEPAAQPKTVRLLTVGNSFSQNATRYLGNLAKARGNTLIHHACVIGGGTMAQHWEKVTRLAKDPADPLGRYTSGKTLQEELTAERWDFVTIQQASLRSHDVSTYRPYASQLQGFIRQYAPQAKLLLHQTWEYRVDDPRFRAKAPAAGEPVSQEAMYRGLTDAYDTIAKELGIEQLPVGDAFHLADSDPAWRFQPGPAFDPKSLVAPALPPQPHSLHVGWRWAKDKAGTLTFGFDGHHASDAGQYLAACVWYAVLFGETPVGNAFVPPTLTPDVARYLQETAAKAVAARKG